YRSSVTVSWSVTDPESGIASSSGCNTTTLAADTAGTIATCKATNSIGLSSSVPVTVKIDKTLPVINGMPTACVIWPPNQKLVTVATVAATDALSGLTSFNVAVTSNEPLDPKKPGIVITGVGLQPRTVQLPADRLGRDSDRIYSITATATDAAGNETTAKSTCTVPHD